jgi:cation transport ATPase
VLQLAASAERRSEHPLAHAIVLVGKRSLIERRGLPIPPEIEATAHDLAERG